MVREKGYQEGHLIVSEKAMSVPQSAPEKPHHIKTEIPSYIGLDQFIGQPDSLDNYGFNPTGLTALVIAVKTDFSYVPGLNRIGHGPEGAADGVWNAYYSNKTQMICQIHTPAHGGKPDRLLFSDMHKNQQFTVSNPEGLCTVTPLSDHRDPGSIRAAFNFSP